MTPPAAAKQPHPDLIVADLVAWRAWLDANEATSDGVWLLLAKKGTVEPTSLTYAQALDEALCSGWIDGQAKRLDDATYKQRFTPRRARSIWSARNVSKVATLIDEGRMRPRGHSEIERAQGDGRWDRAYPGSATAEPPADLLAALAAEPELAARFAALSKQARYSHIHPFFTVVSEAARARRIAQVLAELRDGEPTPS